MSKQAKESSVWDFQVEQLPLRHPQSMAVIPGAFGNFRTDTNEFLGYVSEQYGILQNKALMDAAIEALALQGLTDYETRIVTAGNGRRFYAEFTFKNRQLAMKVGDLFGYTLTLKNSFDRSMRAAFELGFLRLACTNGAAALTKEFGITQRHSTAINTKFIAEAATKALERGQEALTLFDRMADIQLDDEKGLIVLSRLVHQDELSASLAEDIRANWLNPKLDEDKPRNLHTLYQAVTSHTSHVLSANRFEYARKVASGVLAKFARATNDKTVMEELLLPVPKDGIVISV